MIIVRSSFFKSSIFKMFSFHTTTLKRKAGLFLFLWFEEGFRKALFSVGNFCGLVLISLTDFQQKIKICTPVKFVTLQLGLVLLFRVCTGPGKPGKSWNVILAFSRTGKSWKKATGPGKFWKSL